MMLLILKVIMGAIGFWLVIIAAAWFLVPLELSGQFGITLEGPQGMNTGRGDLGGLFLAAGILCFLGLRERASSAVFLIAFAILMASIAFGRIIGFIMDGPALPGVFAFIVEIFFVGASMMLARMQGKQH